MHQHSPSPCMRALRTVNMAALIRRYCASSAAISALLAADRIWTMLSRPRLWVAAWLQVRALHTTAAPTTLTGLPCAQWMGRWGALEEALLAPARAPAVLDEPVVLTVLCGVVAHDHHCMVQRIRAASGDVCKQAQPDLHRCRMAEAHSCSQQAGPSAVLI